MPARPHLRRSRRPGVLSAVVLAVVTLIGAAGLSGCSRLPGAGPAPSPTPVTDLASIEVTGTAGQQPTITLPTPFAVTSTERRVLADGGGPPVAAGQRVTIDYTGVNASTGRLFVTTYTAKPATFRADPADNLKGLVTGLVGVPIGSRVLIAIPPGDGYGLAGRPAAGIGPGDTIVVVADVRDAQDVLTRATGTAVAAKAGLPTVRLDATGRPTITLPKADPPRALVVQPLIVGRGPKVTKGQTITVQYTGVIWPGGKQFDSSWGRPTPASFPIGTGAVIAGWDDGLLGQTVGSQVLLVIPPDKGYGAAGKPAAGIKGTDTLVFVVDVLAAE